MKDIVEPEANGHGEERSLRSIAISLKRIADIMQGKIKPVIMTAEEFAKWKADHEKS